MVVAAVTITVAMVATSAGARGYKPHGTNMSHSQPSYGSPLTGQRRHEPFGSPVLLPRPAVNPIDQATLGSPQPRLYGQKPTLGDLQPARRTSPKRCTGLLCD